MTAREIDELSVLLGEIQARLGAIERTQQEERTSAAQHRSDLRIVIASQSTATMDLAVKVQNFSDDLREVKVLTDDYRENRAQARGANKVVMLFRALVLFIAAIVGGIVAWLGVKH